MLGHGASGITDGQTGLWWKEGNIKRVGPNREGPFQARRSVGPLAQGGIARHQRASSSNTRLSLPPQGPESMVSRQEVKPGSPSLGKSVLPWRREKTGAASGRRVAGRTLPGGLA